MILIADFTTFVLVLGLIQFWNVEGIHRLATAEAHALLADSLVTLVVHSHVESYGTSRLVVLLKVEGQWSRYYEVSVAHRLLVAIGFLLCYLRLYDLLSVSTFLFGRHGHVLTIGQVGIRLRGVTLLLRLAIFEVAGLLESLLNHRSIVD